MIGVGDRDLVSVQKTEHPFFAEPLVTKDFFSSTYIFAANLMVVVAGVYLWFLYGISLVYMSVFVPLTVCSLLIWLYSIV
jgi:hypothetical protein